MNTSPDTTGETAKGRSINVIKMAFPRNSNFAIAHDAARPKTRFSGTLMAAMSSVNRMADNESCVLRDEMKYRSPWANAWQKTLMSGNNKNSRAKARPMVMSVHFTKGDSSAPRREADCLCVRLDFTAPAMLVGFRVSDLRFQMPDTPAPAGGHLLNCKTVVHLLNRLDQSSSQLMVMRIKNEATSITAAMAVAAGTSC